MAPENERVFWKGGGLAEASSQADEDNAGSSADSSTTSSFPPFAQDTCSEETSAMASEQALQRSEAPGGTLSRAVRHNLLAQWGVPPADKAVVRQIAEQFRRRLPESDLSIGDILPQRVLSRQAELYSMIASLRGRVLTSTNPEEIKSLVDAFSMHSTELLRDDMVIVSRTRAMWVENKFAAMHASCVRRKAAKPMLVQEDTVKSAFRHVAPSS